MKLMASIGILVAGLLGPLNVSAQARPVKVVDIASSFDAPGYVEMNPASGQKSGFEVELAEAVFGSQGFRVNWIVKPWEAIVADLAGPSSDRQLIYIASIEGRTERRKTWLFGSAVEFDASHYFFATAGAPLVAGEVVDRKTGKRIPRFLLDVPQNRRDGRPLRIATWKGSAFEDELRRIFPAPKNLQILPMTGGDPAAWLKKGETDVVYVFASGPKNAYTSQGYQIVGGPITNFDLDRFGGTAPVLPMNAFGQDMNRVWLDGFAQILRDDTFFRISVRWFGRVSWPFEHNRFLIPDEAAFRRRIEAFERSAATARPARR